MDAIITAGGLNGPDDPLYALTGIEKKALIPLGGRPMISWVIDAVEGAGVVDHLVIVGLTPDEISPPNLPTCFIDSTGEMIGNLWTSREKLRQMNPAVKKILLCSSDIPLITPAIIKDFVAQCGSQEATIYYAIVAEKTMERQFPNSKRTYIPCKDGRFTGGDVFLVDADIQPDLDFMEGIIGSRKNYLKQVWMFGFSFIFRFLARWLTASEAAAEAAKRAGLPDSRVVITPHAELAMDLDKPHHYELIKAILEERLMRPT